MTAATSDELDDEPRERLDLLAVLLASGSRAQLLDDERHDRDRSDREREQVGTCFAEDAGDEPVAERSILRRERADVRVAEHDQRQPAEDEHAGERHDEGRDADEGDPESLPRADERADGERDDHREPPRAAPS